MPEAPMNERPQYEVPIVGASGCGGQTATSRLTTIATRWLTLPARPAAPLAGAGRFGLRTATAAAAERR
jgi:hypothetical protein